VQNFCEEAWNLPLCRRRIGPFDPADACRVNNRVTRVKEQNLRGSLANRAFAPMQNASACGSMVLFFIFFHKNIFTL
jgi:hypothetical protein